MVSALRRAADAAEGASRCCGDDALSANAAARDTGGAYWDCARGVAPGSCSASSSPSSSPDTATGESRGRGEDWPFAPRAERRGGRGPSLPRAPLEVKSAASGAGEAEGDGRA